MSTSKGTMSYRRPLKQGKTLSMLDRAVNNISEGSAAACHGSDDNIIICDNNKIISGTLHIGGLKVGLRTR